MTAFDPLAALALPADAHVDRRVPKTLLIENGAATAADKQRIRDGVEEIRWLAVLKPTTVGVAEYRDAVREYLEIAVLTLTLRARVRTERLTELVHRAVPYPVLLFACGRERLSVLSLAHKRWSQAEAGRTVLDGGIISAPLGRGGGDELTDAFMCALALRMPAASHVACALPGLDRRGSSAERRSRDRGVRDARFTGGRRFGGQRRSMRTGASTRELRYCSPKLASERQLSRQVAMNLELAELRKQRRTARQDLEVEGNERMSLPRSIDTGPLPEVKTQETA